MCLCARIFCVRGNFVVVLKSSEKEYGDLIMSNFADFNLKKKMMFYF